MRSGVAELPLHYGRAPKWLFRRMVGLAGCVASVVIHEYGRVEFLRRLSDPYFFQSLSCVLGYDWHSSGTTTVTCGALREALDPEEHGIAVAGGKGRASRRTPTEIEEYGDLFGLSDRSIGELKRSSVMAAKVDNSLLQDNYPLYHHSFIFDESGDWTIIQQGLDMGSRTARRYHWLSDHVESFVVEPHDAIVCDVRRGVALNMVDRLSEECRKTSTDIAKEKPKRILRMLKSIRPSYQKSLREWIAIEEEDYVSDVLYLPRNLNWKAVRESYETQPRNYEELLAIRGVGPATVRGLALISDLIYGEKPSWRDPVKYSFAFGGKDGVPFPVDRKSMDEAIQILETGIEEAKIGKGEKISALKRLRLCAPPTKT